MFLQAALSLRESYMLKAPNSKLSGKDKAAIVAKELGDFLGHYKRETELYTVFREESGMVPRHIFEEFIAFANDSGEIAGSRNDWRVRLDCFRLGRRSDPADEAVPLCSHIPRSALCSPPLHGTLQLKCELYYFREMFAPCYHPAEPPTEDGLRNISGPEPQRQTGRQLERLWTLLK